MKRIPEHLVQEITSRSDIVSVVASYVRLEKKGSRWVGLCPFHNEKTPSFGVQEDKGFFYCFGCQKGGDAITFIKEIEKCSYVEALERLAEKAGIALVYEGEDDPEALRAAQDRASLYELYDRLSKTFNYLLLQDSQGSEALSYIRPRIQNDAVLSDYCLGYIPADRSWLYSFLRNKTYSEEFLVKSGLFSQKYPTFCIFTDRLIFPISDIRGKVIAFGGRLLHGDGPKYINSPETAIFKKQDTLFGLFRAIPGIKLMKSVIICEGYMDVLAFFMAGINNAVAPLGTSLTQSQISILKRYTTQLILCFDSDKAGLAATERAINMAGAQGMSVKVIKLAEAKDPAEILQKFGAERLKISLESTINADDFILENVAKIQKEKNLQSAFGYLFAFMAGIESAVLRDALAEKAARLFGIEARSIRSDFLIFLKSDRRQWANDADSVKPASEFNANADSVILAALVANPKFFEQVRLNISVSDFDDDCNKEIFIALEECYRRDELSVSHIAERISNEEVKKFILVKAAGGDYAINPERFIADGIYSIRYRALERRNTKILNRIRSYDAARDADEISLNDLLYEKMYLDGELARLKDERHERT